MTESGCSERQCWPLPSLQCLSPLLRSGALVPEGEELKHGGEMEMGWGVSTSCPMCPPAAFPPDFTCESAGAESRASFPWLIYGEEGKLPAMWELRRETGQPQPGANWKLKWSKT